MNRRQPYQRELPKIWLMTDPRLGDGLLAAVRKLPFGSGIVFRHYEFAADERKALFSKIRRICRQRGHVLLVAGDPLRGADGVHGNTAQGRHALISAPVHNRREIIEAKSAGASLVFLSPLYATRSHPGARPLGLLKFAVLTQACRPAKVIALGGMTRSRAVMIKPQIAYGWAAIDAFKK